jgi:hypothetical protein
VTATTTYAKANAFVVPLGRDAADAALLLPVALGEAPGGTVELNLTAIDRVWPAGGARRSAHPLVRKRAAEREECGGRRPAAPAAPAAYTYVFEALWPGRGDAWAPVATWAQPSGVLAVTLQSGCALVRARRVPAPAPQ